jgi:hypothetical protein
MAQFDPFLKRNFIFFSFSGDRTENMARPRTNSWKNNTIDNLVIYFSENIIRVGLDIGKETAATSTVHADNP